eukprot:gene1772-biopygen1746
MTARSFAKMDPVSAYGDESTRAGIDLKSLFGYTNTVNTGPKISSVIVFECGLLVWMIVGSTNQPCESSHLPPTMISDSLSFFAQSMYDLILRNAFSSMTAPMNVDRSS